MQGDRSLGTPCHRAPRRSRLLFITPAFWATTCNWTKTINGMTMSRLMPHNLTAAIARAGVDTQLEERALQDAILSAIGERRGYIGKW